jgi:biopolymer transport protein ExbD
MKFETTNKPITQFSFSSLLNVIMLVFIFFVLTSPIVLHYGIRIKLPQSKINGSLFSSKIITTITTDGRVLLNSEEISLDSFSSKLSELKTQTDEENLIICADRSINIELIIKIIDSANEVGMKRFIFEITTEKRK